MSTTVLDPTDSNHGKRPTAERGDVYQIINETKDRAGWLGALVVVTDPKPWGIQGYVHHVVSDTEAGLAYVRLTWDKIEYIGLGRVFES